MESVGSFDSEEVVDLVNNASIKTIPPPLQMKTSTPQFLISLSLSYQAALLTVHIVPAHRSHFTSNILQGSLNFSKTVF